MESPWFESQHSPRFYLSSNCPEPFRDHTVFCSIGNGRYNRGQNGWGVMLTTTLCSMPRLRKTGCIPSPSNLICCRYSGTFITISVNNIYIYIYICLFSIKLLESFSFEWSSSKQEWQPNLNSIICPRLLLHAVEFMWWDANVSGQIFRNGTIYIMLV